jgi:hypothetical protein
MNSNEKIAAVTMLVEQPERSRWIVRENGRAISGWGSQREAFESAMRVGDGWERDGYTVLMVLR